MALTQANEQNRLFPGGGHVVLMAVNELPGNQKCAVGTASQPGFPQRTSQAPLKSECASIPSITSKAKVNKYLRMVSQLLARLTLINQEQLF